MQNLEQFINYYMIVVGRNAHLYRASSALPTFPTKNKVTAALNPNYEIEITKLTKVIAPWAFTNNHRLIFGLTSNSLQTPTVQALSLILAMLLHNLG